MHIKTASFIGSSTTVNYQSQDDKPEIALVGRSNVGKSSLINMLLRHKGLAKVAGKPGKTQLINRFLVNETWCLVDLPGYGWAKVSRVTKQKWQKMLTSYLLHSQPLRSVMLLVDSRHTPQQLDLNFINWLHTHHIPFLLILSKIDKIKRNQINQNIELLRQALSHIQYDFSKIILTSSHKRIGRQEILHYCQHILK